MPRIASPLVLACLFALAPRTAIAQGADRPPDLSGSYAANGTEAGDDHKPYEAKVELKRTGQVVIPMTEPAQTAEIYRLKWKFPGNGSELNGVGVLINGTLYVAYSDDKKFFLHLVWPWRMSPVQEGVNEEVERMEGQSTKSFVKNRPWYSDLSSESAYVGVWFHFDETYGVIGLTEGGWPGEHPYRMHQVNSKFEWMKYGNKNFWSESGTLIVEKDGRNFAVRFRESADYSYTGVAFTTAKGLIIIAAGGDDIAGASSYRFTAEGLEGEWAGLGGSGRGTETLTPSDEVMKRAGSLFHD